MTINLVPLVKKINPNTYQKLAFLQQTGFVRELTQCEYSATWSAAGAWCSAAEKAPAPQ